MKKWLLAILLVPGYCHGDMNVIVPFLKIGDVSNSTSARYSQLEFPAGSLDNYATYYVFIATRAVPAGSIASVQSPTTGFLNTNGFGVGESSAMIVRALDNTITQGFELMRQSDDIRILGIYQKSGEPTFDSNGLGLNLTASPVRCSGDLQFSGNLTRNGGNASLSIGSGGAGTKIGMTVTNNLVGGSPNTIPFAVTSQIYQSPPLQTWGSTTAIFSVVDGSGNFIIGGSTPTSAFDVKNGSITIRGVGAGLSIVGGPVTGSALCLNASNALSVCTSIVGAGGTCTCP